MTGNDAPARYRIENDHEATLFVEAAAGTGKTTALVTRIVALLRAGRTTLDRIVAVTYTEKAAGEMKLRLRAAIESARMAEAGGSKVRKRLDDSLEKLELAKIGTIHAFCADVLHERPIEGGVDPLFEIAAEEEGDRLLEAAFGAWFERALDDPPEGTRRFLRRRPAGRMDPGPREQLVDATKRLIDHRDFAAPWRRVPFDRERAADRMLERLEEVGALSERSLMEDDWLAENLKQIRRFVEEIRHLERVEPRDYDAVESDLRTLGRSPRIKWQWRGMGNQYGSGLSRREVIEARDEVKKELDAFLAVADADLAALLHAELQEVVSIYRKLLKQEGKVDFLDLLIRARDLVRDHDGVRKELQDRYTHFFVDEFQDTDPLQAEILLLLAADDPEERDPRKARPVPGKLFLVGDPKQSIYRFRRADVSIYETTKARLASQGAEILRLATSFRSVPSLQSAVNAAFAPVMQGSQDGSQATYVALEPSRPEMGTHPSLVVLPVPKPYDDYGKVRHWKIEASLPHAVGAFVDWLVNESGWKVTERDAKEPVPVLPRHVCVLFRRFRKYRDDVTRPYVNALEARRIPHVLVGGTSFHEREEVLAIRNALGAIEWPDDPLRVFAALKGPLFALSDEVLLVYKHRFGTLHPLRPFSGERMEGSDVEVSDALAILAELHYERNRRPIAETVTRLLAAVRAHAGIVLQRTGEQALANALRLVDLAHRFERDGAPSFRAFVERLESQSESADAQDAPVVEEGTEGVRIMTVHRAKGLEFPVVILADPTCRPTRETPTRHVDPVRGLWAEALANCAPIELIEARETEARRDLEEAHRLAYVAATRARDLLVVPAVGDALAGDDEECWYDVLRPVLFPENTARRTPSKAPHCPPFGADSVLDRGPKPKRGASASVAPGLHRPIRGEHGVVWWDPKILKLDVEESVDKKQVRILDENENPEAALQGMEAHARWQAEHVRTLESGGRPSLRVMPVTELAAKISAAESIRVEEVAADRRGRPHGIRFGTLVHAVLARVDADASKEGVRLAAEVEARLVDAPEEEIASATEAVQAALMHPLLRRAAKATERRRETPALLRLEDGSLAEGVVDLAFREEDGSWTVLDFKTDVELASRRAEYEAQVEIYTRAVSHATGAPARGVILVV